MERQQTFIAHAYAGIKRHLKPPVFEDEEKSRVAVILGVILWSVVAVVSILMITWLMTGKSRELGPYAFAANAFIIGVAIGLLFLLRIGYIRTASFSFVCFLWSNITFQAFTSDGVHGSAAIIYITIMVLAGLLLGWRASIGIAALSTLSIWILALFEQIGSVRFQLDGPYEVALESTAMFALAAVFLTLTTTGLSRALKRARQSEDSLKTSNRALKYNLEQLAQREKALRDSEEKFRLLAENVVDIIWILDPYNLRFIYVSPSVERILGYTPDAMKKLGLDQLLNAKSFEIAKRNLSRVLENGPNNSSPIIRGELALYHKNGSLVWVDTTARGLHINWISSFGIVGVTRDVTERKAAQKERKKLQDQLLQAQKMEAIGTLAGGIAHDFNNILQGVLGYSQILIFDKEEGHPELKLLRQIESASQRASELTRQLLTFGRRVQSKLRPLDLNQEVRQLQQLLERTIPKMIAIETHLAEDLKFINADTVQIEQLMMNLCINSRDAMPDGGKLVIDCLNTTFDQKYCKKHLDTVPGEYVMLRISDNGKGMDKHTLEHVFEPFFTTKKPGKGTGLGLAMVYGIVKNHGGHITCDSAPEKGTTFSIYFPAMKASVLHRPQRHTEFTRNLHGNETILLVDDEDFLRDLGQRMLTRFGYTVLTAPDGETALQAFGENKEQIALVILDLIMPGMGGKTCLEQILAEDPDARVIIASGHGVYGRTKEEIASKAAGFISKPFDLQKMLHVVRNTLDEK